MAKIATMSQPIGKIWKVLTLVAIVMIIWGGVYLVPFLTDNRPTGEPPVISALVVFFGFCLAVLSRFGSWWFHD